MFNIFTTVKQARRPEPRQREENKACFQPRAFYLKTALFARSWLDYIAYFLLFDLRIQCEALDHMRKSLFLHTR